MTEYITKEQALEAVSGKMWPGELEAAIKAVPPADVVEVTRCKDCENAIMYCDEFGNHSLACEFWTCEEDVYPVSVDGDDFCNNGK